MIIGIDLGTTNSAAGYLTDEGPKLINNAVGEVLTPSVVGVDEQGKLLVGRAAREFQVRHPDRCASAFKRHMGSDWSVQLAGHEFTPEKLSSLVLTSLTQDAAAHFGRAIERAVISVPAYFNEHQRKATMRAGQIAGLKVERILNEPTAAAIAYGMHEAKEEKIIVIVDLGGGTFDVSVVELFEGTLEVRASSGESFLGGEDFTSAIAARLLERRGFVFERAELEHPLMVSRLRQQCELAKRRLSREGEVSVRFPNRKGEFDGDAAETVRREQFEAWTEHILARIELPIRRALGDAQLKRGDVQEVILVGGATRMPAFIARVTELFGKEPRCRINPDEVVALGAAVQAGLVQRHERVEELVVTDVCPFTLGVEVTRQFGMERRDGYFLPIINRNTTLPVSRVERVSTVLPNQTHIQVSVYQGENRKIKDNLFLGEFEVDGIPRGPAGQAVDIRLTYDLNGVLEVEATIVESKKKVSHIITRHAKGMTAEQVARAVNEMQALKTHPREEAANRLLLRQAERVYQELPIFERRLLEQMLDGFEEALELRDKDAIERHRQALKDFLEQQDPEARDRGDLEGW
jgi:molecular chaperone HscC